jgi:hypothetical protein
MWDSTRIVTALALGVAAWLASSSIASADVQLTIQDGRVSLVANDATLGEILTAWSAVGHTTIVNAERVPGEPMTLQLIDVPEEQALETLLRSLSGYIAAPRATAVANLSRFDRILVMPTIASPVVAAARAPARFTESHDQVAQSSPNPTLGDQAMLPSPNPTLASQPAQSSLNPTLDEDDGRPAPAARRGRVPFRFAQPQVVDAVAPGMPVPTPGVIAEPSANPSPAAAYPGGPTSPAGVAVPGMIVAPVQPPGQPPGESQPPRRPGDPPALN